MQAKRDLVREMDERRAAEALRPERRPGVGRVPRVLAALLTLFLGAAG